VATDNHVGFKEDDPVRGDDTWQTFQEIMRLAKDRDVDMVLLGGDLFDKHDPSRKSMMKVIEGLRMNCLGDKPCELEFLSDGSEVFGGLVVHYVVQKCC
jgi:double-strand break repair protein MRE11